MMNQIKLLTMISMAMTVLLKYLSSVEVIAFIIGAMAPEWDQVTSTT
jgi:hypothetical protein